MSHELSVITAPMSGRAVFVYCSTCNPDGDIDAERGVTVQEGASASDLAFLKSSHDYQRREERVATGFPTNRETLAKLYQVARDLHYDIPQDRDWYESGGRVERMCAVNVEQFVEKLDAIIERYEAIMADADMQPWPVP